jgi:hypothetical protein
MMPPMGTEAMLESLERNAMGTPSTVVEVRIN